MAGETGCRLYMLWFVRFMKGLLILALLASVAAYIVLIKYSVAANTLSTTAKAFTVLGSTGFIALSLFLCIAEFEPLWLIRKFQLMHYWAGRGSCVLWVGVEMISTSKQLVAAVQSDPQINSTMLEDFGIAVGSILIGCGAIYICLTFLCVDSFTALPELQAPLSSPGAGGNASDALLAANLALALGMSTSDAAKRFGKSNGATEAQKFAKARSEEIANLQKKLSTVTVKVASSDAAQAYVPPAASNLAARGGNDSSPPSYSPPTQAVNDRGATADDSQRKQDDEEELLRQYYGAGK